MTLTKHGHVCEKIFSCDFWVSEKLECYRGCNVLAISLVENKASFKWEALNKPKEFEGQVLWMLEL
jgi:hypothetical protein